MKISTNGANIGYATTVAEAANGEAQSKLNSLNAITWAFLEEDGSADVVEKLMHSVLESAKYWL